MCNSKNTILGKSMKWLKSRGLQVELEEMRRENEQLKVSLQVILQNLSQSVEYSNTVSCIFMTFRFQTIASIPLTLSIPQPNNKSSPHIRILHPYTPVMMFFNNDLCNIKTHARSP